MILGPQQYALVGAQGAALTVYKLRRIGVHAVEVGEGLPFDVLAFPEDRRIVRIQAKATQAIKGKKLAFMTSRGRYAKATKHSIDLTEYTDRDVDLIALAALPLNRVLFLPVTEVGQKTIVPVSRFQSEDLERVSFDEAVASIFNKG